jgi:hypothetical protein
MATANAWIESSLVHEGLTVDKVTVAFDFHELTACFSAICSVRTALSELAAGRVDMVVGGRRPAPTLDALREWASDSFLAALSDEVEGFAERINLTDRGDAQRTPVRYEFELTHDQMVVLAGCLLWAVGRGLRKDRLGRSVLAMIGNRFKGSSIGPGSKFAEKLRLVG